MSCHANPAHSYLTRPPPVPGTHVIWSISQRAKRFRDAEESSAGAASARATQPRHCRSTSRLPAAAAAAARVLATSPAAARSNQSLSTASSSGAGEEMSSAPSSYERHRSFRARQRAQLVQNVRDLKSTALTFPANPSHSYLCTCSPEHLHGRVRRHLSYHHLSGKFK